MNDMNDNRGRQDVMTLQEEIEILNDHLEKLDAAADATRQRLAQLEEQAAEAEALSWPSVREATKAIRDRFAHTDNYLVQLVGVAQDSDGVVWAYGIIRDSGGYAMISAMLGPRANHPAGWDQSWTPVHEMRQ